MVTQDQVGDGRVAMHTARRHPPMPFTEADEESRQDRVVAGGDDQLMKLGVDPGELGDIVRRHRSVGVDVCPQLFDELVASPVAARQRSHRMALQQDPGVDHVARFPVADRDHQSAAFRVQPHPSLGLQTKEGLADRSTADRALRGDLTLADQLTAGDLVCENLLLDHAIYTLSSRFRVRMRHRHKMYPNTVRPPATLLDRSFGAVGHLGNYAPGPRRTTVTSTDGGARTGDAPYTEPTIADQPITDEEIFLSHVGGKLSVELRSPIDTQRDLSIAYTPGVAQVSRAIDADADLVNKYTWTDRLVAVVSDGTAVLGLGDIGPRASLPVMEGKSALFRTFAGLNSIPIVLDTKDPDEIVETLIRLRPSFGAVNLEDISAPRCFEIEQRVIEALDCPVMHDDQHGTAIVVLAALRGATKVLERDITKLRVIISGAGAAGVACAKILHAAGIEDIVVLDSKGIVSFHRDDLNEVKQELAEFTNPRAISGGPAEAFSGADVFVGVSAGKIAEELVATMAADPIIFAMSNPDPEIHPEVAAKYATVVATGRSDFPNQINNVLAFPGVFKGALDAGANRITERMKLAAADAIFSVVADELAADKIVPSPLDDRVAPAVAEAVAQAARAEGLH